MKHAELWQRHVEAIALTLLIERDRSAPDDVGEELRRRLDRARTNLQIARSFGV